MMNSVFSRLVIPLVLSFLPFASNHYPGQATLIWYPAEISTDMIGFQVNYGKALALSLRAETTLGEFRLAQGSGPAMKARRCL